MTFKIFNRVCLHFYDQGFYSLKTLILSFLNHHEFLNQTSSLKLNREILRTRHRLSERQIDDFLEDETSTENRGNRLAGMQRIGTFVEIAKVLEEENIWFLNLKGPLLSQRIYGDPTYRSFRDFDILVKPEDVNQTVQVLQREGFEFPGFEWPQSEKRQQIALHFINQVEIIHPESGVMFEVHWKLFSTRITHRETTERFLTENIETVDFGGQKVNRLSLEFELFYLIVHGGTHAWFRLKWLVDIHEILQRKELDWSVFGQFVNECNAHRLIDICNTMLAEYFPKGPQIPITKSGSHSLESVAVEQCRQREGDPHLTRSNTLELLIYRAKLFPYWQHKMDVTKIITFCKTDLKYNWLPAYKFVYYLFRPVGYVLRGIRILK